MVAESKILAGLRYILVQVGSVELGTYIHELADAVGCIKSILVGNRWKCSPCPCFSTILPALLSVENLIGKKTGRCAVAAVDLAILLRDRPTQVQYCGTWFLRLRSCLVLIKIYLVKAVSGL